VVCAKNYEIVSKCVKVMTKNKVAPFYLGHGVVKLVCTWSFSSVVYWLFLY